MRRYKLFLVSGLVLEIEAKSVRKESDPVNGTRLVYRGNDNEILAEAWLSQVALQSLGDAIVSEGRRS